MPTGIYKRIAEMNFGKNPNSRNGFKKGHKLNVGNKWNVGKKISEETKLKMSEAGKGRMVSEETGLKISKAKMGHTVSAETREKLKKYKGEKASGWRGGISFLIYPQDWTDDLRESIRKRDNYTCQIDDCGIHQDELKGFHKKLSIHHIDYDKENLNPNNLIALCKTCHNKTNSNRDYWIKYFYGC